MISPKDFKDHRYYKYVVFENGEILFCEAWENHSSLSIEGIKPVGAGKIKYNNRTFSFEDYGSFTLKLKESCCDSVITFFSTIGIMEAEGEAFY